MRSLMVMQHVHVSTVTSVLLELCIQHLAFFCTFVLWSLQRAMVISDRIAKHSTELKRVKKNMGNLEFELKKAKLGLAGVDQLKVDLSAVE